MVLMEPPMSTPDRSSPTWLNSANHSPRMRFSLRALLVAVTMCALGIVAVVRASHVTLGVVSVATLVAFLVALSTAIYWVGPRRAVAVGFLAWGTAYAVLALWAFPESDETTCRLITSQLLHSLHPHLQHQTGTQTIYNGSGSGGGGFGGGGFGGFTGSGVAGTPAAPATTGGDGSAQAPATTSGSTSSPATPTPAGGPARAWPAVPPGTPTTMALIEPSLEDWIPLGHMLWAWVFAICGGFVTQAIWWRRQRRDVKTVGSLHDA